MSELCVVCRQPLPEGMSGVQMRQRLEKLGAAIADRETNKLRAQLERQFRNQLSDQADAIRKTAAKEAQAASRKEIRSLQRSLDVAHRESQREAERAAKAATKEMAKHSRKEFDVLKEQAAKERRHHAAETGQLQARVDELSRRLERQSSEQMGEVAESDAFAALKGAFPHDDIQRIGRGVRGGDILQKVIVDGAEAGRIIYECKNVSSWQNDWLTRARGYRSEYQTPWVVIASRCFPRREKWFVVERGVPVIDLRLIVKLAEVLRAAVIEIGQLRTSNIGRHAKAEQMFEYVRSDHFAGRFRGVAEAITALREQQTRERHWHTDAWAKQTRLYDEMDEGRREIASQIRAIAEATPKSSLRLIEGQR